MPALRFKTTRLLPGNVWNRELTIIQRRILRKLRDQKKYLRRQIDSRANLYSYIKLQTTRKLSLNHSRQSLVRTNYIPFPLNLETRSDILLLRLHFCQTLPQARQPISHQRVFVNNKMVSMTHWKVSPGDFISLKANSSKTSQYLYLFLVDKIIGKFLNHPVRMWSRTKTDWLRLLKKKRLCNFLIKSKFLQKLYENIKEEEAKTKLRLPRQFVSKLRLPCGSLQRKRRRRIQSLVELPTHYSEVNHRTPKAVVSYGPNIDHIPYDIRFPERNLLLRSVNGRGQNI